MPTAIRRSPEPRRAAWPIGAPRDQTALCSGSSRGWMERFGAACQGMYWPKPLGIGARGSTELPPDRRLRALRAAVLLCCGLCWLSFGCSRAPQLPPTQTIVWVVIDTLRADALGLYGNRAQGEQSGGASPELDRLAGEALVFERAYSAAPWTVPSVATQLSGRWPFKHGASRLLQPLPENLVTLPQVLARQGWRTAGVTTNFVTLARLGFDRGFERFSDRFALGHQGSYGREAVAELLALSDGLGQEPDTRRFLWTLLFEPHFAYEAHVGLRFGPGFGSRAGEAPYAGRLTGQEPLAELRADLDAGRLDVSDQEFLRNLYQSDAAAADRAFGDLRAGLEQRGLWEEAWVIVTADHGEELGEQGWLGHTVHLSEALVRIPLLIKPPRSLGLPAARLEAAISQVDLFATLLDLAAVPAAARPPSDSRSLLPYLLGRGASPRRYLYLHSDFEPVLAAGVASTQSAHLWGVVDASALKKWIVDRSPRAPGQAALSAAWYDLSGPAGSELEQPWSPEAVAPLWRLRGLTPEALVGQAPAEPLLPADE